jgi:secreted Zn-dependent insulinase-like peptidase
MDKYKKKVKDYLNIQDNNTQQIFNRYCSEIINRTFLFNIKDLLIKQIDSITFNDISKFIRKVINQSNCIKIIIKGH